MTKISRYFRTYKNEVFRIVEGQHFIATRKLVDNDDEQHLLEVIIDKSKPKAPFKNTSGDLHFLLYTPFRYPPLKSGARFHSKIEQSIFYAAEDLKTSMAEVAFHRFLFTKHSEGKFKSMSVPYTNFIVNVKSEKALMLNKEPFSTDKEKISDPSSYKYSQKLGSEMRNAGVELFTYFSARAKNGINVGIFSTEAFASNKPISGKERHWSVYIDDEVVEFHSTHLLNNKEEIYIFKVADFFFDNQFPFP